MQQRKTTSPIILFGIVIILILVTMNIQKTPNQASIIFVAELEDGSKMTLNGGQTTNFKTIQGVIQVYNEKDQWVKVNGIYGYLKLFVRGNGTSELAEVKYFGKMTINDKVIKDLGYEGVIHSITNVRTGGVMEGVDVGEYLKLDSNTLNSYASGEYDVYWMYEGGVQYEACPLQKFSIKAPCSIKWDTQQTIVTFSVTPSIVFVNF